MYVIADVIYGIPITRKMAEWLDENDCGDFNEMGFETPYSGSGDYIRGFLGARLAGFDEIEPVSFAVDNQGNITGLSEMSEDGVPEAVQSLKPTDVQVKEFNEAFDKLPDEFKKVCPKAGIYISWSTS